MSTTETYRSLHLRLRRIALTAVLMVSAPVTAACSASAGADTHPASDAHQVASEFTGETKRLTLPPRKAWPTRYSVPSTGPDGAGHFLEQRTGSAAAKQAVTALRESRTTFMYRTALAGQDRAYFDRTLDSALSGQPELMRKDVASNCTGFAG